MGGDRDRDEEEKGGRDREMKGDREGEGGRQR